MRQALLLNASPITAVRVVDSIKHVWCVAVVVIASDSSLHGFGGTFSDKKCHQMLRERICICI